MRTAHIGVWVFALLVVSVALAGSSGWATPTISVDEATYDFGSALEGETVVHTFVLTNTGDAVLEIEQVRPSCGCTATILSQRTLDPGDSVELRASLHTDGYGGYKISKSITVLSNDPEHPEVLLQLTGMIIEQHPYGLPADELNQGFYVLIDLRSPEAYAAGHLIGATNIPLAELNQWIDVLPDRVRIILYDQDGSTSESAAKLLINAGYPETVVLLGGIDEWLRRFGERFVAAFKLAPPER